jgi:hypothetical protein
MTTETDLTLSAWLLERLDEDEAAARAASTGLTWTWDGDMMMSDHMGEYSMECIIDTEGANPPWDAAGVHIARNDPAHVLAVVAAHRRIVELHAPDALWCGWSHDGSNTHEDLYLCDTLRALAAIYADHGGYRAEWAL